MFVLICICNIFVIIVDVVKVKQKYIKVPGLFRQKSFLVLPAVAGNTLLLKKTGKQIQKLKMISW